jgi:hypothetical protein
MAIIGTVHLDPPAVVINNVTVTGTYTIAGDAFDVATGQPYDEVAKLIGDSPSDNEPIPGGVHTFSHVVFHNTTPITRNFTKVLAKTALNEDLTGVDEISLFVTLTPTPPATVSKLSNVQTGNFN